MLTQTRKKVLEEGHKKFHYQGIPKTRLSEGLKSPPRKKTESLSDDGNIPLNDTPDRPKIDRRKHLQRRDSWSKKMQEKLKKKAEEVKNVLTRSRMFHALVDWAYGVCDDQKTNHINFSELYAGLLLVHVKLAKFAGAAACFPPSKEAVKELFKASDVDRSGGIDREEFNIILSVSCAQIMGRILVNYAMYIFMIPFLAKHLVDYFSNLTENSYLEMVCEQLAGTLLFLVIVPLLHGRIDKTSVFQAERKANEKRLQRDGSVGSSLGISERSNFSSNLSVGDKEGSISFEADEEEDHNLNNQSEDKDSDNEKEPKLAEEEPLKSTEQKKDD